MKKFILLLTAIFFCAQLFAQYQYPATKTVDSSDTYFSVTYTDPYRWLEYINQPEVATWFKQQADYTNSILNKISGRDELIAEWKLLDKLQPAKFRIWFMKTEEYFTAKQCRAKRLANYITAKV